MGIGCFRGAENDLVDRYYKASVDCGADFVVRLPADNPVVEPQEVDRIVAHHLDSNDDFSSNLGQIQGNGYPDGIGAEVFPFDRLERVWREAKDPRNREHVHTYFYEHPELFKIGTVSCPGEFRRPELVLDVNTREQYDFIAGIYDYHYPRNPRFHITDIVWWYDNVYSKREDDLS
jgi:spore coat polysaccharide biosynthesis protein SpsF